MIASLSDTGKIRRYSHYALLGTLTFYAMLLPFSDAFTTFTGPYVLLLFWIAEGGIKKKFQAIVDNNALLFLWLFFLFNVFSLLWSADLHEGIHTLKYYSAIALVATIVSTSLRNRQEHIVVLGAFLVAMFVSEVLSYGIFLGWWQTARGTPLNPTPIMHHVLYSIFLSVTALLLLGQLFDPRIDRRLKILEAVFLFSSTANLFLNGGRTGQLAFIVALFVFFFSYFGYRIRYLFFIALGAMSLVWGAYSLSPIFHDRVHQGLSDLRHIRAGNLDNSWGLRIAMKEIALPLVKAHPVVGVGIGDILDEFHRAAEVSDMPNKAFLTRTIHVHDQFLQITLQIGLLGLALFIAFLIALLRRSPAARVDRSVFYAVLTVYIVAFFIDVPLRSYCSGLFAFIVGYFMNQTTKNDPLMSSSQAKNS